MFNQLKDDVREMLREQITYRELLFQMTRRDLMLRYKQTVMGFGWAVFTPLINTVLFSVIFTRVAPLDTGMPYPLYAFSGLMAWNFFASSLRFSLNSLTSNTNLVTKVYFPREIFPFSAVAVCLVDFAVSSPVLVGLMVYYKVGVSAALLFLPVVLAVHIAFTCGLALVLAMSNLFYRDVKYLFEVVLTVGMFATSVLYPVSLVDGALGRLLQLNPLTSIIEAYPSVLLRGQLPDGAAFTGAAVVSILLLAGGWLAFHRLEFRFAESA